MTTDSHQPSETQQEMPFLNHLEDLRKALVRSCIALLLGCGIVGAFFPFFADMLSWPLKRAMGDHPDLLQGLVTTSPMGIFSVLLQVCFLGGLALSLPFILYFMGTFITPGLETKERRILIPSCVAIFVLFTMGALFSYFLVLPASLAFSIRLNQLFGFQLIWSAPHYYGLVVWMTVGIGLCFEFPIAILSLIFMRLLSAEKLRSLRRHMVVIILIAAALITPGGDPFTLSVLAIPMYFLYEASILIGAKLEAYRERQAEVA
jgi:sec-independent protein translocase protein TatC